jgi:hypothetical protein
VAKSKLSSGGVTTGVESSDEISEDVDTLRRGYAPGKADEEREAVASLRRPEIYRGIGDLSGESPTTSFSEKASS